MLGRTCRTRTACPALWDRLLNAATKAMAEPTLQASRGGVCLVHSTPASWANPDNKPAPPGKDKDDPANVKYDTPTKDPDDTPDYAPGYYDDHGKGGRREVGTGAEKVNAQEKSKHSHQQPVTEEKYRKEEHGDPARDGEEGDDKSVSKTTEVSDSKDRTSAGSRAGESGGMPDQRSQPTGMPQPEAPPTQQEAGPYNPPEAETKGTASKILEEGKVKPGKPAPARPDEPHKYKYQ